MASKRSARLMLWLLLVIAGPLPAGELPKKLYPKEKVLQLGKLHWSHMPGTTCAALSPKGRYLALGDQFSAIRIWEVKTGKHLFSLHAHDAGARSLVFSANGSQIASADADGRVILWDVQSRKPLEKWSRSNCHQGQISLPQPSASVVLSHPEEMVWWSTRTGRLRRTWSPHGYSSSFSSQHQWHEDSPLVAFFRDRQIALYDRQKHKQLGTIHLPAWQKQEEEEKNRPFAYQALQFTDNGMSLLTIDTLGMLRKYAIPSRKLLSESHICADFVARAQFSLRAKWLVVNLRKDQSHTCVILQRQNNGWKKCLAIPGSRNCRFCFSRDERYLTIASEYGAKVIQLTTRMEVRSPTDPQHFTHSVLSSNGSRLVTHSRDGYFRIRDTKSGKLLQKWKAVGSLSREPLTLCRGDQVLVAIDKKRQVMLWDLGTEALTVLPIPTVQFCEVTTVEDNPLEPPLSSYAVSANGNALATIGKKSITIWQLPNGKKQCQIQHSGPGGRVALSPNGKLVAISRAEKNLAVREAKTGRLLSGREVPDEVWSLMFSPQGDSLAAIGEYQEFHLFQAGDLSRRLISTSQGEGLNPLCYPRFFEKSVIRLIGNRQLSFLGMATGLPYHSFRLAGHVPLTQIQLSETGSHLMVVDAHGRCERHSLTERPQKKEPPVRVARKDLQGDRLPPPMLKRFGSIRYRLHGNRRLLSHTPRTAISPDHALIAAPSEMGEDEELCLLDAKTGKLARRLEMAPESATHVHFSPNGKYLTALSPSHLQMWRTATGKQEWLFRLERDEATAMALSRDGKWIACAEGKTLHLLDASSGRSFFSSDRHLGPPTAVRFSRDSSHLHVACSGDLKRQSNRQPVLSITTYRLQDQKVVKELTSPFPDGMIPFKLSPSSRYILAVNSSDHARLYQREKERYTLMSSPTLAADSQCYAISTTSDRVALIGREGSVEIRALPSLKQVQKLPSNREVNNLRFSDDGRKLIGISEHESTCLRIWDLASGKLIAPRTGHTEPVTSLVWRKNGKQLISAAADGTTRFWNAETGSEVRRVISPGVEQLLLSPNGKTLVGLKPGYRAVYGALEPGAKLSRPLYPKRRINLPDPPFPLPLSHRLYGAFVSNDELLLSLKIGSVTGWSLSKNKAVKKVKFSEVTQNCVAVDLRRQLLIGSIPRYFQHTPSIERTELRGIRLRNQKEAFLTSLTSEVKKIILSPNGKMFLVSLDARSPLQPTRLITLYETATGKEILPIHMVAGEIAWSKDSRFILVHSVPTWFGGGVPDQIVAISVATGNMVKTWNGFRGDIRTMAVSPNGKVLATGGSDHTISLWDLSGLKNPPRKPVAWSRADMARLWGGLASGDAATAHNALWDLVASPRQAVPLLRRHLRPVPRPNPAQVRQWLRDLDDRGYPVRERARRALEGLGHRARPFLLEAKKAKPALEMRKRLDRLLGRLGPVRSAHDLRIIRAVSVLEYLRTEKATALLRTLAKGDPEALITQEAIGALQQTGD